MKTQLVLLIVVGWLTGTLVAQETTGSALAEAQKLGAYFLDGRPKVIEKLPAERKTELVTAVKTAGMQQMYENLLVHLGDEETIQRLARQLVRESATYHEWSRALNLLRSFNEPRIVAAIAPALLIDDPAQNRIGLPGSDRAESATTILLEMIPKTPGFSGEVHQWAFDANGLRYFTIQIFREWWKANREHFEKGDYLAVQPGGYPPPRGSYEAYQTADGVWKMRMNPEVADWTPSPSYLPKSLEPVQPLLPSVALPSPPPSEVPSSPKPNPGVGVAIGGAVLLLFAGGLYAYFRKRSM